MGVNVLTPRQPLLVRGLQIIPAGLSGAGSGTGRPRLHCHATYDFSVNGGAISTINLTQAALPANAILTGGVINITTAVTGTSGGTIALGVSNTLVSGTAASCVLAATAIASFTPADTLLATALATSPPAGWVKTSSAGYVTITIAVHALTAGVIEVWLDYVAASNA